MPYSENHAGRLGHVERAIELLVAENPEPFDSNTVANAHDLVLRCRADVSIPTHVVKGYWSIVSLSWPKFEIEVFEDRLEVYHFNDDKSTDVWYEEHRPGEVFSKRFLDELPKRPEITIS
jgi:hypothetical protein